MTVKEFTIECYKAFDAVMNGFVENDEFSIYALGFVAGYVARLGEDLESPYGLELIDKAVACSSNADVAALLGELGRDA